MDHFSIELSVIDSVLENLPFWPSHLAIVLFHHVGLVLVFPPLVSLSDLCPYGDDSPRQNGHPQRDMAALTQSNADLWLQAVLPRGGG